MHKIGRHLTEVQNRILAAAKTCGRSPHSVQLLAVSKTRPAEDIRAAYECGQRRFGENYLQEALEKIEQLQDLPIEWHFIGPLQANKTRPVAEHFDWVHSVDRLKTATRLNDQRPEDLPPLNICLQVNVDDEDTKSGVSLSGVETLLSQVAELPRLQVRGLMAIPAPRHDFDSQKRALQPLQVLLQQLQSEFKQLDTLSMGMSSDLEAAIAAGATIVRVGTDIFGARHGPAA